MLDKEQFKEQSKKLYRIKECRSASDKWPLQLPVNITWQELLQQMRKNNV